MSRDKKESMHWADVTAQRIISQKGDKNSYVCAAGITPSGVVHIGNFREIITVDLVVKALKKLGKDVRFIYSWDDYDVFRKVPKDMPKQDMLKENLRKAIVDVPDPFGTEESYARHHEVDVENDIHKAGIEPEFLYQAKKYRNLEYVEGIKKALQGASKIREVLNKFREEPLDENWLPISGYCPKCGDDRVDLSNYDGNDTLHIKCNHCDNEEDVNINESPFLKLPWRIDWPMRWAHEKVDFEPGGKDHSTQGGSYTTAKDIVKEVYDFEAPAYIMYDFIRTKGTGGKISSSAGGVTTLNDVLKVYEPAIARFLFSGTRPGTEFAISFDLDVLKIYSEFDKVEKIYYGKEEVSDKDKNKMKRMYELSCTSSPEKEMPFQPSFRHLCTVSQMFEHDFEKISEYYKDEIKNEVDSERLKLRSECVKNWLEEYAPEDMKFKIVDRPKVTFEGKEHKMLKELETVLRTKTDLDEESLFGEFYTIIKGNDSSPKEFFKICYNLLINKEKGPKLAPFILEIGTERVASLIEQI